MEEQIEIHCEWPMIFIGFVHIGALGAGKEYHCQICQKCITIFEKSLEKKM